METALILFGLTGAGLYLFGMRRNRPKMALFGIACIDLELAIIAAMFIYAGSYWMAAAFGFSSIYVFYGLIMPSKKN